MDTCGEPCLLLPFFIRQGIDKVKKLTKLLIAGGLLASGVIVSKENAMVDYQKSWDLASLYKSVDDPKISKDKEEIIKKIKVFDETYTNKLTVDNLARAIAEYDAICADMAKLYAYVSLNFQLKQKDNSIANAFQNVTEWYSKCDAVLCKFVVAMQKIKYKDIESRLAKDKNLAQYKAFIETIFRFRNHTLSAPEETVIAKLGALTGEAWYKFHSGILSRIEFPFKGKNLTLSDIVEQANNGETEEIREKANKALSEGLKRNEYALVSVYNNIVLTHKVFGEIRKYKTPEEQRYVADNISRRAVDNMLNAVTTHYSKICHRYYKLKAKILGKKKLQYWDRCSKVKLTSGDEKKYSYEEAVNIVLSVYKAFSQKFYDITHKLVTNPWVDVYPKDGKVSGAFAYSMPYGHPYVMLNFYGSVRDVMTIAHEFGHAIHMVLSSENKYLVSRPPLNISETASTFGEKLTNEYLLNNEQDPKKKIELLCSRLDDVMSTVFRQTAFLKFEKKIHNLRKEKELTAEELNAEWRNVLEESLGDGVEIDHCVDNYWGYITHFTSSPFYVYSYSFGSLFVEGLYAEYKKSGKDFVKKYEEALASGGTKTYAEIAQMFGIDANSREFWDSAMLSIEKEIDELEKLCDSALRN